MQFEVGAITTAIGRGWFEALAPLNIRHPDRRSNVILRLTDAPTRLYIGMDQAISTTTEQPWKPFTISNVTLTYFPGIKLAREWFAAAWAGYLQHEALELTTVGDLTTRPLDPHSQPYETNPYNGGLRDGFPVELTPETLFRSLCVVMTPEAARLLVSC